MFDYYDFTSNGQNIVSNTKSTIVNPNNTIKNSISNLFPSLPTFSLDDKNGILNNSTSTAKGGSLYVGIGVLPKVWSTSNSIGVNAGYNNNETEGTSQLIDIDGDGLQDFVYKNNGTLYYKKYRLLDNTFESPKQLVGVPDGKFYSTANNSWTLGIGANGSLLGFTLSGRID
ncbi:MAG: hypothetical protein QM751_13605 [Paludibacteraceae bacterium]